MSDEKDLTAPRESTGKARATLEQLCRRWGGPKWLPEHGTPPAVSIRSMTEETWRHVSGKGASAVYEKQD